MNPNPFADLGLHAAPDLTDQQVRDAWQATATATGPGRPDGGDPAAYAAASAAYATLRTSRGRAGAYAGLIARTVPAVPAVSRPRTRIGRALRLTAARIRHGRPAILGLRLLAGFLLAEITGHAGAGPAPTAGVLTGLVIWLAITARGDLAPPSGR